METVLRCQIMGCLSGAFSQAYHRTGGVPLSGMGVGLHQIKRVRVPRYLNIYAGKKLFASCSAQSANNNQSLNRLMPGRIIHCISQNNCVIHKSRFDAKFGPAMAATWLDR